MSIAWVFPGQGSQKVGMAEGVINLPGAKDRFELARQLLGRDLRSICSGNSDLKDELSDLNNTRNTQPALFLVESLIVDDMKRQGRQASLVAGHSLGEFVALYAAEVFDAETALRLLACRSDQMATAGGGAMTAVLGFDRSELDHLVMSTEGVVIANDNSTGQVVLSGSPEGVNAVTKHLACKRAIPLKVSGAFHSPFMEDAAKVFNRELDDCKFDNAVIPVISNSEPTPTSDGTLLKERLKKQMTTGVRWRETMDAMIQEGITTMVEIGPGNVLSGLVKRSFKDVVTSQLGNATDLGH
ncbi:ACP S-malonyltransferase [Prochlorococcus sp. MIT 1300]|uniref:ACP S-malonyltransferase n=1 Tax=Prochlorococcus sp. MIT 1300 TaxID=3096218 RepID=UPI002A75DB9E|nr:ACP S-malonyltransferase [Prochlorococcus sp. MIT 1300]